MSASPLLLTRGLGLRAAGRTLLSALDWQVEPGQRWCVIGRNAAGKSSLLRALAAIGEPGIEQAGEVLWLGRPARDWPAGAAAAVRSFMPQQPVDRFAVSVTRLLELSVVLPRQDSMQSLRALDVEALATRNVLELSGGERQRVALAQCAAQGAPLMLLDEPVAFQDPAHQGQVARWLAMLSPEHALVLSAHDVNWIARTATHVLALLPDGRCEQGRAETVLNAQLLERVYACAWRNVGRIWVAD
jgi:iron complex transport system ATP-binding protein